MIETLVHKMALPNERFAMNLPQRFLLLMNQKPAKRTIESATPFSFGAIVKVELAIPDGQIITLIDPVYRYLVGVIEKNPEIIYQIDPRKWEEIIAAAYDKEGFDEVILTPRSGDYGRDVIAIKKGFGSIKFIDQVKAYKQGHIVKADEVRALLGVLSGEQDASKAIFTTTSTFAPKIEDDKFIKPFLPYRLELVNKEKLIARLLSQGGS
jgi:restriction system protein